MLVRREVPAGEEIAAIHRRAGLDPLRADRRVLSALEQRSERRVVLAVDRLGVRDRLELRHEVVPDRAWHRGESRGAGLEGLHGDEA